VGRREVAEVQRRLATAHEDEPLYAADATKQGDLLEDLCGGEVPGHAVEPRRAEATANGAPDLRRQAARANGLPACGRGGSTRQRAGAGQVHGLDGPTVGEPHQQLAAAVVAGDALDGRRGGPVAGLEAGGDQPRGDSADLPGEQPIEDRAVQPRSVHRGIAGRCHERGEVVGTQRQERGAFGARHAWSLAGWSGARGRLDHRDPVL
jgi:hypothetical protein